MDIEIVPVPGGSRWGEVVAAVRSAHGQAVRIPRAGVQITALRAALNKTFPGRGRVHVQGRKDHIYIWLEQANVAGATGV